MLRTLPLPGSPLLPQHAREQVLGLCYIILEILDLYGLMFRGSAYSADPVWFNAMKVTGILVTAAALRNFGHLAKSNVNKGMFAESRTFSYGEFWAGGLVDCGPPPRPLPERCAPVLFHALYSRELIHETAYRLPGREPMVPGGHRAAARGDDAVLLRLGGDAPD
eukprot:scaffold5593_cov125-Isochrysis_galbana.AAC.6